MRHAEPSRRKKATRRSTPDASQPSQRSIDGNQGEGNREADRRYREGATAFARSGGVKEAAQEALRAIEEDDRIQDREHDVEGGEAEPGSPRSRKRSRPS